MTKLAYLDCPTGISGDMCLGALVDAGVPIEYLTAQLKKLGITGEFHLQAQSLRHNAQQATKVTVELLEVNPSNIPLGQPTESSLAADASPPHSHPHPEHPHAHHAPHHPEHSHHHEHSHQHSPPHHPTRNLPDIEALIQAAHLPDRVTAWSLAIFRKLAQAEGAVHGIPAAQVHFHEVGAVDAIVDVVGTCLGLDWLGIDEIYCSALPTGGGTVWAAHGRLPVPVPAVLKLFEQRQVPIFYNGIDRELVTPTGAAIVTTLASHFGHPPAMTLQKVGLGAGTLELPIPNMVRLWIGNRTEASRQATQQIPVHLAHPTPEPHKPAIAPQETIAVLETQIDDLSPQAIGYVFDRLFAVGALDVFTQAIGMKKSRPGILLTVICPPAKRSDCEQVLFQETTTLGIRTQLQERSALTREFQTIQLPYGHVTLKVAKLGDGIINLQPEYEDCAAIARQHQIPWREVHQLALVAGQQQLSRSQTASPFEL